jgi:AcrR family transcriptional regulator
VTGTQRDRLLEGARRCLEERGYARTTARQLAQASGANLASIGYHFGSKEALLNEAILTVFDEYTEKLLALALPGAGGDAGAHVRRSWIAMVDQFAEMRPLLVAFIEAMAQAERSSELRQQLSDGYERLRGTIASSVLATARDLPPERARTIASFMIAVADGLMIQWLLDPARTPGGADLFDTVRLMFGGG